MRAWSLLLLCGCTESALRSFNTDPVARITSHATGDAVASIETYEGLVSDVDVDPEDLAVAWLRGNTPICAEAPEADGSTQCEIQLSADDNRVVLQVTDDQGASAYAAVTLEVGAASSPPDCVITAPTGGVFEAGETILFEGTASDPDQAANSLEVTWSSDKDGLLGTGSPSSSGAIALVEDGLSSGTHLVTLTVEDDAGDQCDDFVVVDISGPPSLAFVFPAAAWIVDEGVGVDLSVEVDDADEPASSLQLNWESSVDGVFSTQSASSTGLATVSVALSRGVHGVTVTATDSDGGQGSDTRTVTWNGVPTAPEVSISPDPATAADVLLASVDVASVDPEGQTVTYSYSWTRDGVPTSHSSDTVPASSTAAGDLWAVTVTPADVHTQGPAGTASITVDPGDTGTLHTGDTGSPPPGDYTHCELPAIYQRVVHSAGTVDFIEVEFAPDGSYALLLEAYAAGLYHFDALTETLSLVDAAGSEEWTSIAFSEDGSYALVGGADSSTNPVLYRYEAGAGLAAMPTSSMFSPARITSISRLPGADRFAILSDNTAAWPSKIAYLHELRPDFASGSHSWTTGGAAGIDQVSRSVAWGKNLGQDIALAVDNETTLLVYDPGAGSFAEQSHPNVGNLAKVMFAPDGQVAWVLQWSGNGKVYAWEGLLRTDSANSYAFGGWTRQGMAMSPDGHWKLFVGSNGTIYWSDSPWRPVDSGRFSQQDLPNFGQSPWNGATNDALRDAAWRPGTCEGLVVGDATSGQGLVATFTLF